MRQCRITLNRLPYVLAILCLLTLAAVNPIALASGSGDGHQLNRSGFTVFPGIWYTPETKLAGGGQVMYYFRSSDDRGRQHTSSIPAGITYTQRKQIAFGANPDVYFGRHHLFGEVGYLKFPDLFYGIGNETTADMEEDYTPRMFRAIGNLQTRVYSHVSAGVVYQFEDTEMDEIAPQGLLASQEMAGYEGGRISGLGMQLNWDSRDSAFYATRGSYHQMSATIFDDALGSDYTFRQFIVDLRHYLPVFDSHTLAVQAYGSFLDGDAPFRSLSQLGGENLLRAYQLGRFRDQHALVFQAEYRVLPVFSRFGLVGFAGVGQVARDLGDLGFDAFKYSVGVGIRYQVEQTEGINVKIDMGWGEDSSGFYFGIGEAF